MAIQTIPICSDPIFVVGSPRSGTSILGWSLAQHSHLWTSAESNFLFYLFGNGHAERAFQASNKEGSWLDLQNVKFREFAAHLGYGMNALQTTRSQGKRWVDQSPSYTIMIPLIEAMFSSAIFIHILRDGRKVVNSMLHSGFSEEWARDFREACRTWNFYVVTAKSFEAQHPDRCITVRNEDLTKDPQGVFRVLCHFLGIPFEEGPGNFFGSNLINSSFQPDATGVSAPTARLEGNPSEDWTAAEQEIFLEEASDALRLTASDSFKMGDGAPMAASGITESVGRLGNRTD